MLSERLIHLKLLLRSYKRSARSRDMLVLQNKAPSWNEHLAAYCLNFSGRVTMASVKNFQLVEPRDQDTVLLQFGKARLGRCSRLVCILADGVGSSCWGRTSAPWHGLQGTRSADRGQRSCARRHRMLIAVALTHLRLQRGVKRSTDERCT